jgi:hypothetical protein
VGSGKLDVVKQGQGQTRIYQGSALGGKNLRLVFLTLYYGGAYSEVLQWRRRMDLA